MLNDPEDVDRARVLYDKGTNRHAFMLGQVDKYTWKDTGSSFGLSDVLAAYLLGQLEQRDAVQDKRRGVSERYAAALAPYADELGFEVMRVPRRPGLGPPHVLRPALPPRPAQRRARADAQGGRAGHLPLPAAAHLRRRALLRGRGRPTARSPRTSASRLLRLPFHNNLSDPDLDRVVAAFLEASTATLPER